MRRAIGTILAAGVLMAVPPLGGAPAAALDRVQVIDCRPEEPTCWPTAFAFTPNGDQVYYVERFTGQIRRHTLGIGNDVQWAHIIDVATSGEQGLLGITLDPRWQQAAKYRWVYVYFTHQGPLENRILRLRKTSGGLKKDVLQTIPAATGYHNGGIVHIGPDGKLFAVTGEAHQPARAQDKVDPAGKVLRMNLDGSRPGSNPIPGSKAFSYGHRNSFGFTFDPGTGRLWQTENGPGCEDEINWVRPGRNYGWGPASDCPGTSTSGPNPVKPKKKYTPTIAPTGAAFCDACGLGAISEGDLFFGAWNDHRIRRLQLNGARNDIVGEVQAFTNPSGVLSLLAAPDGRIFFSDANGIYRLHQ